MYGAWKTAWVYMLFVLNLFISPSFALAGAVCRRITTWRNCWLARSKYHVVSKQRLHHAALVRKQRRWSWAYMAAVAKHTLWVKFYSCTRVRPDSLSSGDNDIHKHGRAYIHAQTQTRVSNALMHKHAHAHPHRPRHVISWCCRALLLPGKSLTVLKFVLFWHH